MTHETTLPPDIAAAPADFTYDLLVIGSGPGGQRAAIQAAKPGKKVAVVERKAVVAFYGINRLGSAPALEPKLEPVREVGVVV